MLGNGLVASKAEEGFKCHSDCFAVRVGLHHHSLQVAFAADRVFYKNVVVLRGCTQIPVSCVSNSVVDFKIIRGVPPQSSNLWWVSFLLI